MPHELKQDASIDDDNACLVLCMLMVRRVLFLSWKAFYFSLVGKPCG